MKKTILLTLLLAVVLGFSTANAQSIPPPSECPDLGPSYGSSFSGNVADPNNPYQYVAIWNGVTIGCVACPPGLVYNEEQNLCIYGGFELMTTNPVCGSELRWFRISGTERVIFSTADRAPNEIVTHTTYFNGRTAYHVVQREKRPVDKTQRICLEGIGACLTNDYDCEFRG